MESKSNICLRACENSTHCSDSYCLSRCHAARGNVPRDAETGIQWNSISGGLITEGEMSMGLTVSDRMGEKLWTAEYALKVVHASLRCSLRVFFCDRAAVRPEVSRFRTSKRRSAIKVLHLLLKHTPPWVYYYYYYFNHLLESKIAWQHN